MSYPKITKKDIAQLKYAASCMKQEEDFICYYRGMWIKNLSLDEKTEEIWFQDVDGDDEETWLTVPFIEISYFFFYGAVWFDFSPDAENERLDKLHDEQ